MNNSSFYPLIPACCALFIMLGVSSCRADAPASDAVKVGPQEGGGFVVPTHQWIRPAGQSVEYHGRPVDLALTADGKTLYVKSDKQLLAIDTAAWRIRRTLDLSHAGASMHGIAVSADGRRVYVTGIGSMLVEVAVDDAGKLSISRRIKLPGARRRGESYPCGIALFDSGKKAAVCLSMDNNLAIVDLSAGKVVARIPVGVAPYDVAVSENGGTAYVSNWGGRRPRPSDRTAESAGTPTVVDERGIASTGTIGIVDIPARRMSGEIPIGLHPADLELAPDGKTLFVTNANSDTVSLINLSPSTGTPGEGWGGGPHPGPPPDYRGREKCPAKVVRTIPVRPDEKLPFGSMSNALALQGGRLFVADGGNNAIAVVDWTRGRVEGFIPTGWYPAAVVSDGQHLFIANAKGVGSRDPADKGKWRTRSFWGSITRVNIPAVTAPQTLAKYTEQVRADAQVPQALSAWERAQSDVRPAPVPAHVAEPSVIKHVLYIIKENRTYDQVFGDLPKGNNDPKLCVFGRSITPNQHALAEQFALLDNYYCNGVLSADGHAWATEGVAVDYLEKTFGGWARSYPFWGNDPLAMAPTGFIWDNALLHGLSFRNYGEMSTTSLQGQTYGQILQDAQAPLSSGGNDRKLTIENSQLPISNSSSTQSSVLSTQSSTRFHFNNNMPIEALRRYSCPDSPGWNLNIPDQLRADVFLKEFKQNEKSGQLSDLTILYLPEDHTYGTRPGKPAPESMVADNDLAVGRVADAISHSRFWPRTCIFVIEDDPQAGFDHVDGHRSTCLVISPYTKRRQIVSHFYNQTSVLHTIELMLGLPPLNQFDALSPAMGDCFTPPRTKLDLTPFTALPNEVPLDRINPPASALKGEAKTFAEQSAQLPFDKPDECDENTLNRILWQATRGNAPYPAAYAGAHGRGLGKLHLKLDTESGKVEDED